MLLWQRVCAMKMSFDVPTKIVYLWPIAVIPSRTVQMNQMKKPAVSTKYSKTCL